MIRTLWIVRGGLRVQPKRTQTVVETIYTFAETNIGKATLPEGAYTRWFPYVATLFIFIWIINIISFIPLPLDTHNTSIGGLPGFTIYAATSNISVTLTLTLCTIFISHFEGIRSQRRPPVLRVLGAAVAARAEAVPDRARGALAVPADRLAQRPALRQHARRPPADHHVHRLRDPASSNWYIFPLTITAATFFYVFEFGLVASLQAYIFAMLSGIYIGSAIEPQH